MCRLTLLFNVFLTQDTSLLAAIYQPLTSGSYYERSDAVPGGRSIADLPPILQTSAKAAELIKHASNAFLAMKISFVNVVANLCEAVDADVQDVARGMGLDKRIGMRFLNAGIGYGGSCFPKDVAAFSYVAQQLGVDFGLLEEVEKINDLQKERFSEDSLGIMDFTQKASGGTPSGFQRGDGPYPRFARPGDYLHAAGCGKHDLRL